MFDKVVFRIPEEKVSHRDFEKLDEKIKSFSKRKTRDGSILLRGSLSKFYFGDSLATMSFEEVKIALDELYRHTQLNLHEAYVLSLEFGASLIVSRPPCEYLKLFGNCKYFNRMNVNSSTGEIKTVTYCKKSRRLKFIAYDKLAEMKDKRRNIPDLYKEKNVLRLEFAINKKADIKKIFNKDLKAYDLANLKVFRTLQKMFYSFYLDIPKTGRCVFINPSSVEKMTVPKFMKLICEQYRQIFANEYDLFLQDAKAYGLMTNNTVARIRAENTVNYKSYYVSRANELITELDALIEYVTGKII